MPKTTTELADEVLFDLTVADASETPDTADRTRCTDAYASIYAELAASEDEQYTYWDEDDDIPDAVFLIMCDLVRLRVQGSFGQPVSLIERRQTNRLLLRDLRRIVGVKPSGMPTQAEYF